MLVAMAMFLIYLIHRLKLSAIYIVGCEVYSQVNDSQSGLITTHIIAPPTDVLDMT